MSEMTHEEHVTVDAWHGDCIEGECDHTDESGEGDFDLCPMLRITVCVDCMDAAGAGREEEGWDGWPLDQWPHPGSAGWVKPEAPIVHGPEREPALLKPAAEPTGEEKP